MAVFGAPVAHEDDPERAVRAGLADPRGDRRAERARARSSSFRCGSVSIRVRLSCCSGSPAQGEGIVAGDVVNTAARIQSGAPVNAVAVSEETFRQTERMFMYEALAPVEAKGKSRAGARLSSRGAAGTNRIGPCRDQETPFVGREVEKTLLQGLFDRCARDSTVELVTLVGEPGVGKSRLCAELSRYIDERAELIRWRQGRCLPYGEGITFWALGELVKSHAGIFESDSPEVGGRRSSRKCSRRSRSATGSRRGCCR